MSNSTQHQGSGIWSLLAITAVAALAFQIWKWTHKGPFEWSRFLMLLGLLVFALANYFDPDSSRLYKKGSMVAMVLVIASLILTFAGW